MEPRLVKHEKRTDLSYNLPHRVYCSAVYPVQAPNGSTVILYGYKNGLRLLWRGGRRSRRRAEATETSISQDVIALDDSEDAVVDQSEQNETVEEEVEADEEPHGDYPAIVHDITVEFPSPVARIAVPIVTAQWPATAQEDQLEDATVVIATLDGHVLLLNVPLAPSEDEEAVTEIHKTMISLYGMGPFTRDISLRLFPETKTGCIATASDQVHLWSFDLDDYSARNHLDVKTGSTPLTVSLHPSSRSPIVLVADASGTCRIFEPPEDWEAPEDINEPNARGTWTATFLAPHTASTESSLPVRKRILDAKWLLSGRCILATFNDGSWGVWDTTSKDKAGEFVVSGLLDSASDPAPQPVKKSGLLAPMTPNTRKAKSTALFAPQPKTSTTVARGGITVSRSSSVSNTDESVMIWLNSDVYTIPSTQAFWQRSTSSSKGLGSLSAPGIARVPSLNLFLESVTSISTLPGPKTAVKITRTPDFVLSAESRIVIVEQNAPSAGLFAPIINQDQGMLDAGELDLGGMDRLLNTMDTTRRVGFAH